MVRRNAVINAWVLEDLIVSRPLATVARELATRPARWPPPIEAR